MALNVDSFPRPFIVHSSERKEMEKEKEGHSIKV